MKLLFVIIAVSMSSSLLGETVSFCSADRAELSNKDGSGYYWDLLREIYALQGIDVISSSATFNQCLAQVEHKRVDGAIAAFRTTERIEKFTYPRSRLHNSSYGFVSLKQHRIDQIGNLDGLVGLIDGYDFSGWLPQNLDIHLVKSTKQALTLLKLKRIKYHADDIQDALLTLKQMGESPNNYAWKQVYTRDLYLPFTKDTRGQILASKFDKGIRMAFENGSLAKLVEKYGLFNSVLEDFNED